MTSGKLGLSAVALCALLGAVACGDDDDGGEPRPDGGLVDAMVTQNDAQVSSPDSGTTPIDGMDSGTSTGPAVYVAATRVFPPEGTSTTYVQVLTSLDQGTQIETGKATEFAGPAELFALESPRWIGIGDGEMPLLSSYKLDGQKIAKDKTVSVQSYGLQSFFSNKLYQVSPTKVYLPDPDNAQLIIIDPTNMKVIDAIALPDTVREGYTPVYSYDYVKRDGKLLFSVGWFDYDNDKILPSTGLVVINTDTNAVLRTDEDARCGGITQPITLASGDTYFPSSSLAASSYQLQRLTTEPCVLRIKAGADAFDASYHVKLRELTGSVAGEPVPAGGDEIFLRVLDAALVTIKPESASWNLTGQAAWRWRRWNPITGALVNVDALQPSTADTFFFQVDGRIFNSEVKSDYSSTTLMELNAPGGPKPALTGPGLISGLARIQ